MQMTISQRERQLVWIYAAVVMLITTLPYLAAWFNAGPDHVFSGFLVGNEDGNSYLGKMRLGARGEWSFTIFYTSEVHPEQPLTFLPYIVAGQIVGVFFGGHDPLLTPALIVMFHLMRIAFGLLMIVVTHRFIAYFVRRAGLRWLALVLATLGGGFGWLLFIVSETPPEWLIPEAFAFQILFGLPHLALARSLLLTGLLLIFSTLRSDTTQNNLTLRDVRVCLLAGACFIGVGLCVPFYLAILYCILGIWGLTAWIMRGLRWRTFPLGLFWRCLIAGGVTLPFFIYYALAFYVLNPVFTQWSAQNILRSPLPHHYLLAYFPIAALALIGGRRAWRRADISMPHALLIGWVIVAPILVYLPINVQRRMSEAVIVPLAVLAVWGVQRVVALQRKRRNGRRMRRHQLRRWYAALIGVCLISNLLLYVGACVAAGFNEFRPVFIPTPEARLLRWLDAHTSPTDVVLASSGTRGRYPGFIGNFIPAYTDARSFIGHGPETLFYTSKRDDVVRFYRGEITLQELENRYRQSRLNPPYETALLPIRYIVYGPAEWELLRGESYFVWADMFTLVYSEDGYEVYEVPPEVFARMIIDS
jgi:hypothetical protein